MKVPKVSEMSMRMLAAATAGVLAVAFGGCVLVWWSAQVLAWWQYGLVWTGWIVVTEAAKIARRLRRQARRMMGARDDLVALLKSSDGRRAP